jgi:hypothetical protein
MSGACVWLLESRPRLLQVEAANAYARVSILTDRLYITEQTANILLRREDIFAPPILADTRTLRKARYLRRWARRLKDFSFSAEDAIVLAYGSFGVDPLSGMVGADAIITTDIRLAKRYDDQYDQIEKRFKDMVANLSESYSALTLPQIATTAEVLARM